MSGFRRHELDGVIEFTPKRFGDSRGDFAETYKKSAWAEAGVADEFVQDNQSRSALARTLRGLHYQIPPYAQAKIVRVLRGRALDVAVDIRKGSPSFGRWAAVELSAEKGNQLYVPVGFAHGLLTLEPDTEVHYKVTAEYARDYERGVIWNDPALGLPWPLGGAQPVLSDKDRMLPRLQDADAPFAYP